MAYEKQNPTNNATPWDEDHWGAMDDAVADHDSRLETAESDIAQNKTDIAQAGSNIEGVDQKITDEAKTREDKDDELSEKIQSNTDLIDSLNCLHAGYQCASIADLYEFGNTLPNYGAGAFFSTGDLTSIISNGSRTAAGRGLLFRGSSAGLLDFLYLTGSGSPNAGIYIGRISSGTLNYSMSASLTTAV